jgi:carbamoyl-phosphate synthase large subunit
VDLLGEGKVHLVVNTPEDIDRKQIGSLLDSRSIRLVATELGIPVFTTMAAALAGAEAIAAARAHASSEVQSLQELHPTSTPGIALQKNRGFERTSYEATNYS